MLTRLVSPVVAVVVDSDGQIEFVFVGEFAWHSRKNFEIGAMQLGTWIVATAVTLF